MCTLNFIFPGKFGVCWCMLSSLIYVCMLKKLHFCRLAVVWLDLSEHSIMECQSSIWWCHCLRLLQQRVVAKSLVGPMLFFLVAQSCLMLHGLFCSLMQYGAQSSIPSLNTIRESLQSNELHALLFRLYLIAYLNAFVYHVSRCVTKMLQFLKYCQVQYLCTCQTCK